MTEHHFETHEPVDLQVETGKGTVKVTCADTTESTVTVEGRDADDVRVELNGRHLDVIAPRNRGGFFGGDSELHVTVVVPTGSNLGVQDRQRRRQRRGRGRRHRGQERLRRRPHPDLRGPSSIETGSGDIRIDQAQAELRIKSGSGDVRLGHGGGCRHHLDRLRRRRDRHGPTRPPSSRPAPATCGSAESYDDVSLATGSGDFVLDHAHRGRLTAKGASGDVRVAIPAGTPGVDRPHHRLRRDPFLARGRRSAGRGPGPHRAARQDRLRGHRPHPDLTRPQHRNRCQAGCRWPRQD